LRLDAKNPDHPISFDYDVENIIFLDVANLVPNVEVEYTIVPPISNPSLIAYKKETSQIIISPLALSPGSSYSLSATLTDLSGLALRNDCLLCTITEQISF
jgi:hypothetical protein